MTPENVYTPALLVMVVARTVVPSGPISCTVCPAIPPSVACLAPSALASVNTVPVIVLGAYSPALTVVDEPEVTVTGAVPVPEMVLSGSVVEVPVGEKLLPETGTTLIVSAPGRTLAKV